MQTVLDQWNENRVEIKQHGMERTSRVFLHLEEGIWKRVVCLSESFTDVLHELSDIWLHDEQTNQRLGSVIGIN